MQWLFAEGAVALVGFILTRVGWRLGVDENGPFIYGLGWAMIIVGIVSGFVTTIVGAAN